MVGAGVVFAAGVGLGQALDDNAPDGGTQTLAADARPTPARAGRPDHRHGHDLRSMTGERSTEARSERTGRERDGAAMSGEEPSASWRRAAAESDWRTAGEHRRYRRRDLDCLELDGTADRADERAG